MVVYTVPRPNGYDSDMFCQLMYEKWWKYYEVTRLGRYTSRRAQKYEPAFGDDFTRYPESAPVEAFLGKDLGPLKDSWHSETFACVTGCQDLRKTIEWIIAMSIESKQHVRARLRLAFICEKGTIAVLEYGRPSKREVESQEQIDEALASLANRMPTKSDKTSLEGESENLTKCKCVSATDPAVTSETRSSGAIPRPGVESSRGQHKRRQRSADEKERAKKIKEMPTYELRGIGDRRPHARIRRETEERRWMRRSCDTGLLGGLSSDEVEPSRDDDVNEPLIDIADFEIDDTIPPDADRNIAEPSMCFDFEYPQLPEPITPIGTIQRVETDEQARIRQENERIMNRMLQAALSSFCADFTMNKYLPPPGSKDRGT